LPLQNTETLISYNFSIWGPGADPLCGHVDRQLDIYGFDSAHRDEPYQGFPDSTILFY